MENEIIILAKAGYNREEINEILNPPTATAQPETPVQSVEQEEPKAEEVRPKKNDFSEVLEKIESLEQKMFKKNVQESEIKQNPAEITLEKVMEQLVR